jgi:hypothetical protein
MTAGMLVAACAATCLCAAVAQEAGPNTTGLSAHPCVLVNAQTLPLLRAKAADERDNKFGFSTKSAWDESREQADQFLTADPYRYRVQIPARGNQPTEPWEYTLSDDDPPRHDRTTWYPPWTAMFQERADSISTRLRHLSFAYLVTGDKRYFERAKRIVLHLAKWSQWTDPSYGGGGIEACLDTGHATQNVALFYDWCFDELTPAERDEIGTALIEKGMIPIAGYVDHYPAETNGYAVLTCGLGLAALAIRPEDERGAEFLALAIEKTRRSLDLHGIDGGAFEGPMYGTYLLDSFATFFDALVSAQVEHDLFDHPYLATMDRYVIGQLSLDTRTQPCFSDGSPTAGYRQTMRILAQRGSTDAAWYLQQINALDIYNINDFIRFDAARLDPVQPTWNPSVVLVDTGHASLRDGYNAEAPFLAFKSGPPQKNIGHNHYDHNSFVLSFGGEWLICDRGYHHFTDPPKTKFTLGTIGHNTIALDLDDEYRESTKVPDLGHDQQSRAGGRIARFFTSDAYDFVHGDAAKTYNSDEREVLSRFDRSILFVKPDFYVIRDQLAAPEPHRFTHLLHVDSSSVIRPDGDAWVLARGKGEVWTRILSPLPLESKPDAWPGAENYGTFLATTTPAETAAELTTFLYPRPAFRPEFIANRDFELGMNGWSPRGNEDLPNHTIDDTTAHSGEKSARVENSGYYYSSRFSVPAGTKIKGDVWLKTTDLPEGQGAVLTFYFWRDNKSFANEQAGPFSSADWSQHSVEAVVPEGTDEISLALNFFAPGACWFDDVTIAADIERRPPATPQVTPLADGAGLAVELPSARHIVLLGAPGTQTTGEGYTTDGEVAVVSTAPDGATTRLVLQEGTFLRRGDEVLLQAAQPATIAAEIENGKLTATVATDLTPHAPLAEAAAAAFYIGTPRIDAAIVNATAAEAARDGRGYRITVR